MENSCCHNRLKTAIIILSALLAVGIIAVIGVYIFKSRADCGSRSKTAPNSINSADGIVSPSFTERANTSVKEAMNKSDCANVFVQSFLNCVQHKSASGSAAAVPLGCMRGRQPTVISTLHFHKSDTVQKKTVKLNKRHPEANEPFNVVNMFPGDTETKYYLVRVSHNGSVVVKFRADIRPGYEKLAEVLMCRIELLTTGETLYEGLMRDMPRELNHLLAAGADNELYYKITAYLDTSVGNEYQNKELVADFIWWMETSVPGEPTEPPVPSTAAPTEAPVPPSPHTGDRSYVLFGAALIGIALVIVIIVIIIRRKNKKTDGGDDGDDNEA